MRRTATLVQTCDFMGSHPKRWLGLVAAILLPVQGWISSPYGYRVDPFTKQHSFHSGVDISSHYATAVKAALDGSVSFAGKRKGYGNLVVVDHRNSVQTYYGHLGKIFVEQGNNVVAGQAVGWSGMTGRSTGPHVHFEVRKKNSPVDPKSLNEKFFVCAENCFPVAMSSQIRCEGGSGFCQSEREGFGGERLLSRTFPPLE